MFKTLVLHKTSKRYIKKVFLRPRGETIHIYIKVTKGDPKVNHFAAKTSDTYRGAARPASKNNNTVWDENRQFSAW